MGAPPRGGNAKIRETRARHFAAAGACYKKECAMRIGVFVAGMVVGLTAASVVAQQNQAVVGLTHVAIAAENVDEVVAYYTEKLGLPEAVRIRNDQGQTTIVFVQVSRDTFLEIQPVNAQRPKGINHLAIHVQDLRATVARLRQQGVTVDEPRLGTTKALLAFTTDSEGNRVELIELPPGSLPRLAIDRWK